MIDLLMHPERRVSWRRLFAFIVATGLLLAEYIGEATWWQVCAVFIAAEVATKGLKAWESRGTAKTANAEP